MTGLLEQALKRVESLSREEQDAIAAQILETLDDEDTWAQTFQEKPEIPPHREGARRDLFPATSNEN